MTRFIPDQSDDLYSALDRVVEVYPDEPFIWFDGTARTYSEVKSEVDKRAALLKSSGIGKGDRIGVLLPNDPEFVYLLFGIAKRSGITVTFNSEQKGSTLEYLLNDAGLDALVVDEAAYGDFEEIKESIDLHCLFTHDVDQPPADGRDLDDAVSKAPTPAPGDDHPTSHPHDVAVLNYTSGTTGPPKGVKNPHSALLKGGREVAKTCKTDRDDRGLIVLPLFHANPLCYGLMHMLIVGGSIAIEPKFSASGFWEAARDSRATFFTHVGSILTILYRVANNEETDIDTTNPLKFGFGGAAQFDHKSEFEEKYDLQLVGLYGMSEIGVGVVTLCEYDPDANHAPGHQGSISSTPIDVKILSDDGLEWLAPGEAGEILARPTEPGLMFRGYLNKHEETIADWQDLWFHTGDLGKIDQDGNLHYLGRLKTNIRKYDENISPWELESVLNEWDRIEKVVAVGVPDDVAGEEIKLVVIPSQPDLVERDIYEQCQRELAEHVMPRYIELVEKIPHTSTQKIARQELSDRGVSGVWDAKDNTR